MPPSIVTRKPRPIDGGPKGAREQAPKPAVPQDQFRFVPNIVQAIQSRGTIFADPNTTPEQKDAAWHHALARAEMRDGYRIDELGQEDITKTTYKRMGDLPADAAPEARKAWEQRKQLDMGNDLRMTQKELKDGLMWDLPERVPFAGGEPVVTPITAGKGDMPEEKVTGSAAAKPKAPEEKPDSPVKSAVKKYMAYKAADNGPRTVAPKGQLPPGATPIKERE